MVKNCGNSWTCCFNDGASQGCPKSIYKDAYITFWAWPFGGGSETNCGGSPDTNHFPRNQHMFTIGKWRSHDLAYDAAFTNEDAYNIDHKYDDAIPTTGIIQARSGWDKVDGSSVGSCLLNSSDTAISNQAAYGTDSKYKFSDPDEECVLSYIYTGAAPHCPLP